MSKGRVLVAMSGGIDSSIAALMLHEEGYEIIGVTMKVWDYETSGSSSRETGCCSLDSINDARNLAVKMGFPHYILDLRKEFEEGIVSNFVSEYMKGRTPNPCVLCNSLIKWDALLEKADNMGCAYIATGHYAIINQENGRYYVTRGVDASKDQSYVLWGLSQQSLGRTLLPLGLFNKQKIRSIAKERGFSKLADKRESYEICFVPDDDYRRFLQSKVEGMSEKLSGGNFVSMDGSVLGTHKGYPNYTIGQRKGLEIAAGYPLYVVEINADTNTIVLGKREDLLQKIFTMKDCNMMKYSSIDPDKEYMAKIRYNNEPALCRLRLKNDSIEVEFYEAVSAITPGQSAVIYENDDIVAGGFIN